MSRWQAEWNLARALQVDGQTAQALKRVTRLVNEPGAAALPSDLLVRMAWLQARLAFESGSPAEAIRLVDALLARLEAPAASDAAGRAQDGRGEHQRAVEGAGAAGVEQDRGRRRPPEGLDLLKKLRADYPKTDAAVYSYIAEADYHSARNEIVAAQTPVHQPRGQLSPTASMRRLPSTKPRSPSSGAARTIITRRPTG